MSATRYVEGTIQRILTELAATPRGGHGLALFKHAAAMGGFVAAGAIAHSDAFGLLMETAADMDYPERRALSHVERGLREGMRTPRALPCGSSAPIRIARPPIAAPQPAPAPRYPLGAVKFFAGLPPVTDSAECFAWLTARGLDPAAVELWDLARALPPGATCPSWAHYGPVPWSKSGHRLVLSLFDARGAVATVRARDVTGAAGRKSLAPQGFSTVGAVHACPLAQQVLAGGGPLDWWARVFYIVEGWPDFATWATAQPETRENGPAVFGIESGAWAQALADRVPNDSTVVVATHADGGGDDFAARIAATFAGRSVDLRRHRIGGAA